MFSNKNLYIPDYVVSEHIPIIIKYFEYYNIAKVKKVDVFKHPEPEYYVENSDNYGFALIEIDTYYNNQGARNFYNAIENHKGLIVYDDPNFWVITFNPFNKDNCKSDPKEEKEEEEKEEKEEEEECYSSYDEEEASEAEEEEEKDDFNYNNYEKNFNCFKNKQNSKKQKITRELLDIKKSIIDISTKQEKLLKLLIINNKLKNNSKSSNNQKPKDSKNTWTRRLRILF